MKELSTKYNSAEVEERWAAFWREQDFFHAKGDKPAKRYSIVIPPPNVTGVLHFGHALNNTLQDILVRWKRMQGFDALWMPGCDHAGIATQNVVERELAKEKKSRHDLGREKFVERVWVWKEKHGGQIINQLKKLGASCDYERERFTMDEGLSRAVTEVFVKLYEEGLIYRSKYIVNWCPRCSTALSDLEVEYQESQGNLWHIYYPFVGTPMGHGMHVVSQIPQHKGVDAAVHPEDEHKGTSLKKVQFEDPNPFAAVGAVPKDLSQGVVVATTRPETMLGDTAVAVHPEDERYKGLIGKKVIVPLINREISIIADPYVDKSFGSGAVKITPAHDPNDFQMGKNHNLEVISVIGLDGVMSDQAGSYKGLDRFAARKKIVEDLEQGGWLVKKTDHTNSIGHCQRCRTIVEPMVSLQWFVRMKPLAEPAIQAVKDGRIQFIPANWDKTYFEWMENIRDWCISRQIWWGHRIPVWYCQNEKCQEVIASRTTPIKCPKCGGTALKQDEDVLDTWFSSALWPFSTLGWPEQTKDLKTFYPTNCLVTGFDIIFFWVARMIMMGLHFMGDVPFRDVYIHALVRDADGKKMSKSKGNVVDPLVMIEKYGCDALRFTLTAMAAQGRDVLLDEDRINGYRNFCNKLWNASRFVLMNQDAAGATKDLKDVKAESLSVFDRWILSRLDDVCGKVQTALNEYKFNEAAQALYDFVWHEYCDWYIELSKPYFLRGGAEKEQVFGVHVFILDQVMRLLHPIMPFITEEIWNTLPFAGGTKPAISLSIAAWPNLKGEYLNKKLENEIERIYEETVTDQEGTKKETGLICHDEELEIQMDLFIEIVTVVRNLRRDNKVPPGMKIPVTIKNEKKKLVFNRLGPMLREYGFNLMGASSIEFAGEDAVKPKLCAESFLGDTEAWTPLVSFIDFNLEKVRVEKEQAKMQSLVQSLEARLANQEFIGKAPAALVEQEKTKREDWLQQIKKLDDYLKRIKEAI